MQLLLVLFVRGVDQYFGLVSIINISVTRISIFGIIGIIGYYNL